MLFFDLEFYVPKKDREESLTSLKFRAPNKKHVLLGGVFIKIATHKDQYKDQHPSPSNFQQFWVWKQEKFDYKHPFNAEKVVLSKIFAFFRKTWNDEYNSYISWRRKKGLSTNNITYNLITCGTGISRVDLPSLYIKGVLHEIASPEELFQVFLTTTPIDLTNVGMLVVKPKGRKMKPVPTSDLLEHFGLGNKESGRKVWEYYDNQEFEKIEKRTLEEVKVNIELFYKFKEIVFRT